MLEKIKKIKPSGWQIIALGYAVVILLGSFLLSTPIASKQRIWTSYIDALFTSTSATCVTGLVVFDTYTHWSIFGQIVIIVLTQIGGIGFMTIISLFAIITRRQIGIYERTILVKSAGTMRFAGVVKLIKKILIGTFLFETLGAILLSIEFIPKMGFGRGLYYAIFHSISAFCNAGFDLMGVFGQYSSLSHYLNNPIVNFTIMMLTVIGGLGFIVWGDIWDCRFRMSKYQWHTKIVLTTTIVLIISATILYMLFENNNLYKDMNFFESLMAALFQAVTPRTSGFSTIDLNNLSDSSILLATMLMFIGGSSGSTAGGIKITTFVVILFGIKTIVKPNASITIGKKKLEEGVLRQALAIFTSYIAAIFFCSVIVCAIEPFTIKQVVFEIVSAIGTVGLSLGITPGLSVLSKIIVCLLMYAGRVGIITIVLAFVQKRSNPPVQKPTGELLIG